MEYSLDWINISVCHIHPQAYVSLPLRKAAFWVTSSVEQIQKPSETLPTGDVGIWGNKMYLRYLHEKVEKT